MEHLGEWKSNECTPHVHAFSGILPIDVWVVSMLVDPYNIYGSSHLL